MTMILDRRGFLGALSAGAGALALPASAAAKAATGAPALVSTPAQERAEWIALLQKIASPLTMAMSRGRLRADMPVERGDGYGLHADATYVEAVGRGLAGIAPWLALRDDASDEGRARKTMREQVLQGLVHVFDPARPDRLNFNAQQQPIVDAAYLAHAFLRAPDALWKPLDAATKKRIIDAFISLRDRKPPYNNWLLFVALTETFLRAVDADWDPMRVDVAIRKFEEWYVGDGWYSDGEHFAYDYYNGYVIHPMLIDVLRVNAQFDKGIGQRHATALKRMQRYGVEQERMISPEGAYAPVGRSITYRSGAFQALAQLALQDQLPEGVSRGQVRAALGTVHRRIYTHPGTFDAGGWLTLGFVGHQPHVADYYTSTGSLFMATLSFLPLGLPADHAFWTEPAQPWTSQLAWAGEPFRKDYKVDY
jgi:hypothetical protein